MCDVVLIRIEMIWFSDWHVLCQCFVNAVEITLSGGDDETTKQQLLDVGRDYGIVTPNTSFIVLETLDQVCLS